MTTEHTGGAAGVVCEGSVRGLKGKEFSQLIKLGVRRRRYSSQRTSERTVRRVAYKKKQVGDYHGGDQFLLLLIIISFL